MTDILNDSIHAKQLYDELSLKLDSPETIDRLDYRKAMRLRIFGAKLSNQDYILKGEEFLVFIESHKMTFAQNGGIPEYQDPITHAQQLYDELSLKLVNPETIEKLDYRKAMGLKIFGAKLLNRDYVLKGEEFLVFIESSKNGHTITREFNII